MLLKANRLISRETQGAEPRTGKANRLENKTEAWKFGQRASPWFCEGVVTAKSLGGKKGAQGPPSVISYGPRRSRCSLAGPNWLAEQFYANRGTESCSFDY